MILSLYTDGSAKPNPGKGGWAFLILNGDEKIYEEFGSSEYSTNNRMEMEAVVRGLTYILKNIPEYQSVNLYSDSEYIVKNLKYVDTWKRKGWKLSTGKPVKNVDKWQEIKELDDKFKNCLNWEWVKAHSVNEYNQRVDFLANNAAS